MPTIPPISPDQQGENRRQWVDIQVTSYDPRRSEIVLHHSPNPQQHSHPDPVRMTDNTNTRNRGQRAHPAKHRDELQQSPQHSQCDGVRKSQKKHGSGIEHERKATEKYLGPYVSGEHDMELVRYGTNPRAPVPGKEHLDQQIGDTVTIAQEENCQDGNKKQPAQHLRGIGKVTIHASYQPLDVLSVPRQEGPETKFLFLTPTVLSSQFGRDVSGREAIQQNRHFIHQFHGVSG